ncbi:MAG TPA: DnaJ family domain-containing protein [Gammaproteobacteria bacterium]|nr:DnaJ family domain-containing protein [Gammaproteobacteria bacterium]
MFEFEKIAEQRILDGIARGELDDLPGAGAPLDLDDDALVPAEVRLAFRVLKNAGYLPEEVRLRREISDLEAVAGDRAGDPAQRRALNRLALLRTRLATRRGGESGFHLEAGYREKILQALSAPAAKSRSG